MIQVVYIWLLGAPTQMRRLEFMVEFKRKWTNWSKLTLWYLTLNLALKNLTSTSNPGLRKTTSFLVIPLGGHFAGAWSNLRFLTGTKGRKLILLTQHKMIWFGFIQIHIEPNLIFGNQTQNENSNSSFYLLFVCVSWHQLFLFSNFQENGCVKWRHQYCWHELK